MSIQNSLHHRPKVHFTPPAMWINDPNGLVYIDGVYHLFYQYYPEKPVWGPMHWGHAVSTDLMQWEHQPIALYPDELGMIFSGSCVYDIHNVSGLGAQDKIPLIAIYTSHNNEEHFQQQSIAYSTDHIHFEKYENNPVIPNPGLKDFRDPKAFWNPVYHCWSLVLAAADRVNFYSSKNLKHWDKTGEFLIGANGLKGICECPDCFPVETEDGTKWILVISMIIETENEKENPNKTQYFIGTFDGNTFLTTEESEGPLWLNYGPDHYAGVTFQNMEKPILIGWASNWAYAGTVPTQDYRGMMSLPCAVSLKKTPLGYRAALQPVGISDLMENKVRIDHNQVLLSQSFGLHVIGTGQGKIMLSNACAETLVIEITEEEIIVDRTKAGQTEFSELYASPEFSRVRGKRYKEGQYEMEVLFDVSVLEVFAEDGLLPITMLVYPQQSYELITFEGEITADMYLL